MNVTITYSHDDLQSVKQRDAAKQRMCQQRGITLIVIPYWWNKTVTSVARTIHRARPDVPIPASMLSGDIIPTEPPHHKPVKGNRRSFDVISNHLCRKRHVVS